MHCLFSYILLLVVAVVTGIRHTVSMRDLLNDDTTDDSSSEAYVRWEEYSGCKVGFEFEANKVYVKADAKDVILADDGLEIQADSIHDDTGLSQFRSVEFVTQPESNLQKILAHVWKAERVADNLGKAALDSKTGWIQEPTMDMAGSGEVTIRTRANESRAKDKPRKKRQKPAKRGRGRPNAPKRAFDLLGGERTFLFEDKLGFTEDQEPPAILWSASPQVTRGVPLSAIPQFYEKAFERSGSAGTLALLKASLLLLTGSVDAELAGAMYYVAGTAYQLSHWPMEQGQAGEGPKAAFSEIPMPRTSFRSIFQQLVPDGSGDQQAKAVREGLLSAACIGRAVGLHRVTVTNETLRETVKELRDQRLIRKEYIVVGQRVDDDLTLQEWVYSMSTGRHLSWLDSYPSVLRGLQSEDVARGATFGDWSNKGSQKKGEVELLKKLVLFDKQLNEFVDHTGRLAKQVGKHSNAELADLIMLLRYADEDYMSPPPGLEGFHPRYSLGAMGLDGQCVVMEERAVEYAAEEIIPPRHGSWQDFAVHVLGLEV